MTEKALFLDRDGVINIDYGYVYRVEDFKLTYIDDPLYNNHFTDWFDGIQFRFDNGPNKINDALSLVEIKDIIYSDTLMEPIFSIKMNSFILCFLDS